MIFNNSVELVEVPTATKQKAFDFANNVALTTDYSDHNQSQLKKIIDDHFVGKLGEEAVKIVLEKNGNVVVGPDYNIYKPYLKSWRSDLYVSGTGIAVKTQRLSTAKKYGMSWTFADSDTRRDPILRNPKSWVYFVICVDNSNFSYVFVPQMIGDLEFGEPVLKRLLGHKRVVYLENIIKERSNV